MTVWPDEDDPPPTPHQTHQDGNCWDGCRECEREEDESTSRAVLVLEMEFGATEGFIEAVRNINEAKWDNPPKLLHLAIADKAEAILRIFHAWEDE